jgi:hypothetical protein
MLDAHADGADWREFSRIVLHIDAEREPDRATCAFDTHLAREMDDRRSGAGICCGAAPLARRARRTSDIEKLGKSRDELCRREWLLQKDAVRHAFF